MQPFLVVAIIIVLVGVLATVRRVIVGPTLLDRILAVNVIGTKTIVLLAMIGFVRQRPGFYLDIALTYALVNFIATIAVLRIFERRLRESRSEDVALLEDAS